MGKPPDATPLITFDNLNGRRVWCGLTTPPLRALSYPGFIHCRGGRTHLRVALGGGEFTPEVGSVTAGEGGLTSVWPSEAAPCRGVSESGLRTWGSAPAARSAFTTWANSP
eukprot:2943727-Pyramimonas_sp.AAC.1